MLSTLLIYLGIGSIAGVMAGLLGVGGGLLIVPALIMAFSVQGVADSVLAQLAVGTSLATIVITSLASVRAHQRHGAVRWREVALLTPGIILGAWVGAAVAAHLPSATLRTLFGIFALLVALQMGLGFKPAPHQQLPGALGMSLAGAIIGLVSSIVGIGGGSMTVPFLTWCHVTVREAVAISAACGLPIALAGAAGFVAAGWSHAELPAYSSGFVYWPAFAGIVTTSMLFAGVGAKLAHTLPTTTLKRLFAAFLFIVGLFLLFVD
jgi:uncharacterized membrane protein YfcA